MEEKGRKTRGSLLWIDTLRNREASADDPKAVHGAPVAPAPGKVRTLRRLVRLRNMLAWCWIGGLTVSFLLLGLYACVQDTYPALKRYLDLPMLACTLFWVGAVYAGPAVDDYMAGYMRRHFRISHLHGLTYWSDLLPRGSSAGRSWSLKKKPAEIRSELLRELSRLTEDTVYFLSDGERRALYKTLYGQDSELISAVLRVAPLFGDVGALPALQHLAEGRGAAETNKKVQAEAQAGLHRLQALLDLSSGSQGLLRAASAPQAPEEHLLHPLQGARPTDPAELLRTEIQKPVTPYERQAIHLARSSGS